MIIKRAKVVRWLAASDPDRHKHETEKAYDRVRYLAIEQGAGDTDVIVICSEENGNYIDEIWYHTLEEALEDIPTGFDLSPEGWVNEPLAE
ncbi:MAG: hypothetical protein KJ062_04760 [Thermoanaerobaculia bacterium]|nr:hypothetical protein [Thermoanaerobaculia bacterium]